MTGKGLEPHFGFLLLCLQWGDFLTRWWVSLARKISFIGGKHKSAKNLMIFKPSSAHSKIKRKNVLDGDTYYFTRQKTMMINKCNDQWIATPFFSCWLISVMLLTAYGCLRDMDKRIVGLRRHLFKKTLTPSHSG